MSPEDFAEELRRRAKTAPWGNRGAADAHTIRRVERGHVPGDRVAFVLAAYFGLRPDEIWLARNARVIERTSA